MPELLDFDVAIEPLGDGYRARVVASPAGEAYTDFALPFTDESLTILVLRVIGSIGRAQRKVRRIQSEERRLLENFGDQLFQSVFSGPVRECLGRSRLVADSRDAGLRIRLRLPGVLANIPWEYLYDSEYGGFISLSPETALVRYLELPAPVRPFPISPPLRILAMISAPSDVPELEDEEEWHKLTGALDDLVRSGLVQVDRLADGTLAALQRPLRLHEYHVLHFIGHGGYDEDAQDGALAMEGTNGQARLVTGRDLGLMIREHRSLRLVVLNACEGARSARDDPFGGVAQALVRQGIPAVIAMQFEISDPAALVFSRSFYQAIADGLPVDVAMVEARRTMFAEGNEVEWATPVLYLRSADGRIFTRGHISEADRQAQESVGPIVSITCPGCKSQQQIPGGSRKTNCGICGKEIAFGRCPKTEEIVPVLSESTKWTHAGCRIIHLGPTVTCPGCKVQQQMSDKDLKMKCVSCGKEVVSAVCDHTFVTVMVLSEWTTFTHGACRAQHMGPSIYCPGCKFLQQRPLGGGEEMNCARCGKKITFILCMDTKKAFAVLSEWKYFTHIGCKTYHKVKRAGSVWNISTDADRSFW